MRRIGWDIGGAHLKAAVAEDGRIVAVVQEPCALWQGLDRLDAAFAAALGRIGAHGRIGAGGRHQATMTGELVDLFSSRAEGVAALAGRAAQHLGADVTIYAGRAGQIAADNAAAHADDVASANWHATARLTAAALGDGLLIDMGSTTTDIIPVRAGAPAARGYSDAERLATGELVYTGVVRTPLMALAADIPFAGRRLGVMAEHFATSADIWRLLGRLPEGADQHGTADGRGKSVAESRLRLSRMVGVDVAEASAAAWRDLAAAFAEAQIRRVQDAAAMVLSGAGLPDEAPVVACGAGAFAIEEVARRLGRPCRPLADLIPATDPALALAAAACAPAAAMALL